MTSNALFKDKVKPILLVICAIFLIWDFTYDYKNGTKKPIDIVELSVFLMWIATAMYIRKKTTLSNNAQTIISVGFFIILIGFILFGNFAK